MQKRWDKRIDPVFPPSAESDIDEIANFAKATHATLTSNVYGYLNDVINNLRHQEKRKKREDQMNVNEMIAMCKALAPIIAALKRDGIDPMIDDQAASKLTDAELASYLGSDKDDDE